MNLNPYQSPATDEAVSRNVASLASSLAFGAYAGAIAWATAGVVSMALWGMCLAPIVGESPMLLGVGGAFWGCFGGGVLGAIAGLAIAGLSWSDPHWPKQRTVFALLPVAAGWLLLMFLGFVLIRQVLPGSVAFIPSFIEANQLPLLLIGILVFLIFVVGTPTGLWLAERVERFVHPPKTPSDG